MNRRDFLAGAGAGAVVGGAGVFSALRVREANRREEEARATVELRMIAAWPKNLPGLSTSSDRLVSRIAELSNGRVQVKLFAPGEMAPADKTFDTVAQGGAEAYHGIESYWRDRSPGYDFFASVPFGLSYLETQAWLQHGGGQELWDELAGGFNIHPIAAGNTGAQMGGWFRREINKPVDLAGLKIFAQGLGGEVLRRAGAIVVNLPASEIYPSLQSGSIDAAEWLGPWNDLSFAFQEVAPYYYGPGILEPSTVLTLGLNRAFFEKLAPEHRRAIQLACQAESIASVSEFTLRNAQALQTLTAQSQVQPRQFSPEIVAALRGITDELLVEAGQTDGLAKRISESYVAFRDTIMPWTDISQASYLAIRANAPK